MASAPAKLITFALSHYCEAGRWALDWHNIPYTEIGWPPGVHRFLARRAGAKRSSVPIVITGDTVIEGSHGILDWAEASRPQDVKSLTPALPGDEGAGIEGRLDKGIGVNVRRFVYAHLLPDHAGMVKPMLFTNTSTLHRLLGLAMWPLTKNLIIEGYRTGGNARQESRDILQAEFEWLEGLIAKRGGYLDGKSFSRLDLMAASLLSPLALPAEMPLYRSMQMPDDLTQAIEAWSQRPVMDWVREIYREHRNQAAGRASPVR